MKHKMSSLLSKDTVTSDATRTLEVLTFFEGSDDLFCLGQSLGT